MVKQSISILLGAEALVLVSYIFSPASFANVQVAFLSSLFVIVGSSFAYSRMVAGQISAEAYEDKRDLLDEIEDPHGLYDEKVNEEVREDSEALDLKAIVKEERSKIKTFSLSSIKHGARGGVSAFRILPYIFLILGFIALKNNEVLDLSLYLPSLLLGIVTGSLVSKNIAS